MTLSMGDDALTGAVVEPLRLIINTRISDLRPDDLDDAEDPGSAVTSKAGDRLAHDGDQQATGREYYGPGLADQEQDCRKLAELIGQRYGRPVEIVKVIPEPNISAYKRRRVTLPDGSMAMRVYRPGLRETLQLLTANRADGAIWLDLDRAFRDPRDLEDLIDVVEASYPRKIVQSVTGSLQLATDADIAMARVMVAIANKSSRDTARRVARSRRRQAEQGKYGGGSVRPYGFEKDGVTVRADEAEEILNATVAVLGGATLDSLAMDLRQRNVSTVTGARWTPPVLRGILLRPRNAGFMVYRPVSSRRTGPYGEKDIVGTAPWDPIVEPDQWRAVVAKLTDPDRVTGPGNTPRWLGAGLYMCCRCGTTMIVARVGASGRVLSYRCRLKQHLIRHAANLDTYVEKVIIERLSRPDAAELIVTSPDVDIRAVRGEIEVLRMRLNDLAEDYAEQVITRSQMRAGSTKIRAKITRLDWTLRNATALSPLAPLIESEDVAAHWAGLSLAVKRSVLKELMDVVVLPMPRGRHEFRPDRILLVPKMPRDDLPDEDEEHQGIAA